MPTARFFRFCFLCAFALAAGCDRTTSSKSQTISVDPMPVADIYDREATEDVLLEFPSGGTRLSNGNIVINDYYGARVAYFDSTGKLLRTVGGHGKGPGEFGAAVVWLGQCARDSAFVFIFDLVKVAVLDSIGRIGRTYRGDLTHGPRPCNREGESIFWESSMTHVPRENDPPLKGKLSIGPMDEATQYIGEFSTQYGPLRPRVHAVIRSGKVFVGTGETGAIDVYSKKGAKLETIETGAQRTAVTDAQYDAALDQYVTYLILHDDRVQMKQLFKDRFHKPDRGPAFSTFEVDDKSVIWVVTSLRGDMQTVMRAISADDGHLIGVVTLPVELTIFEIGENYILGSYEDEEGFPHVVVYRVNRT